MDAEVFYYSKSLAHQYGFESAILFYWLDANILKLNFVVNEKKWCLVNIEELQEVFYFLTKAEIKKIIQKAVDDKLIFEDSIDKELFFALCPKVKAMIKRNPAELMAKLNQ